MRLYSFDDIRSVGNCVDFLKSQFGVIVKAGRCNAFWRGGDGQNVSVQPQQWYDHVEKVGGGIIELCCVTKFGGVTPASRQSAQEFLGDLYGLTPKTMTRKRKPTYTRYKNLLADGYHVVQMYKYTDEHGNEAHTTIRLEKDGEKKQFVQQTPDSDTLEGAKTYLYNLPDVIRSNEIYIAEGEKDAETLKAWGLCGTTAPMGARKWKRSYTESLSGKDIIVVRDKDDDGLAHARLIAEELLGSVKSLKVVCPWKVAKDVTEWTEIEHGTRDLFLELVGKAEVVSNASDIADVNILAINKAKELNLTPFRNYTERTVTVKGVDKIVYTPRPINELIDELFVRFLNFPCRLGDSTLFDFDRDTDTIEKFNKSCQLFAWIGEKSKNIYDFRKIDGAVTKEEFFEGVFRQAKRYEAIVKAPIWPVRDGAFYAFRDVCKPTKNHEAIKGLMEFFAPANKQTRVMLPIFFAAPLYYRPGIQRPAWVIDSADGAGVGKTTLVELLARLYRCDPIRTSMRQLNNDFGELLKNVLSAGGRQSRVLLVDNATGDVSSDAFADMITATSLSGRVPYGRGEEVRPNDITYCVTANNASLSNDIASRSFCLLLRRPVSPIVEWKDAVISYIEKHRFAIFGDIIDALENRDDGVSAVPKTRVPEFEREVVQPLCEDFESYDYAMTEMIRQRDASNVEYEAARQVEELIHLNFREAGVINPETSVVFIRQEVYRVWIKDLNNVSRNDIRSYIKSGMMTSFGNGEKFFSFPRNYKQEKEIGLPRSRGIMWFGSEVTERNFKGVMVIGRIKRNEFGIVNADRVSATINDETIIKEIKLRQLERGEILDTPLAKPNHKMVTYLVDGNELPF